MKYIARLGLIIGVVLLLGASCVPQGNQVPRTNTPVNNNVASTTDSNSVNSEVRNSAPTVTGLPKATTTRPVVKPVTTSTNPLPCNSNAQCVSGKLCVNSECVPAETVLPKDPVTGELLCNNNAQCIPGKLCVNQHCVPAETALPTNTTTGQLLCSNDAQCVHGKVCVNGNCVASSTTSKSLPSVTNCSSDSQCKTGEACFQGRCTTVPATCKYHTECLSDDYVCSNGTCVWPGSSGHTCQNSSGERWHCLNTQKCGVKEFECI